MDAAVRAQGDDVRAARVSEHVLLDAVDGDHDRGRVARPRVERGPPRLAGAGVEGDDRLPRRAADLEQQEPAVDDGRRRIPSQGDAAAHLGDQVPLPHLAAVAGTQRRELAGRAQRIDPFAIHRRGRSRAVAEVLDELGADRRLPDRLAVREAETEDSFLIAVEPHRVEKVAGTRHARVALADGAAPELLRPAAVPARKQAGVVRDAVPVRAPELRPVSDHRRCRSAEEQGWYEGYHHGGGEAGPDGGS
jgi:hypothetical protein